MVIRRPGIYLVPMMWWLVPFFLRDALIYKIRCNNSSSYMVYLVGVMAAFICGILLNIIENKWNLWQSTRYYGKCSILMIAYSIMLISFITIILVLDQYRLIGYLGGDAGGSVGLLCFPSIIGYMIMSVIAKNIKAI
jgi:hypothetical protein